MAYSYCNTTLPGPTLTDMCGASTYLTFMSLVQTMIGVDDKITGGCERVHPIETSKPEYDFVVVGGGGAGAVVASRLSENPEWNILLLEAGSDETAAGQVPLFMSGLKKSMVDWNYTTSNESYACQAANGSCKLSSGKMLGGGTSLNAMVYLRGVPEDYNNWAAQGNEGWTWEDVLPFFLMAENNGEIERVGRLYHATGGPLSVERFPYLPAFGNSLVAAASEANYGVTEDLNGKDITGFTVVQTTNKHGVRRSSSSAYLWPARNRKNLDVSLNSLATKVVIEDNNVVGVEYYKDGELKTVRASREVVISAGAIRSPQLLLLSGIGPEEYLESMEVPVVKDLPGVGENYHDHVAYRFTFSINEPDEYDDNYDIAEEYVANLTGPLSGLGLIPVIGRMWTESASPSFPNLQFTYSGYAQSCAPGEVGALESTGRRSVGIHVANLHPKSRGRISLASNDPLAYPIIWGNYLADPRDVEVLLKGVELSLALADTPSMQAYNYTLATEALEACSDYTFLSTEYWACAIRQAQVIDYHLGGSCKMGPSSDSMAVVDSRLRVHGINGLRVVDASIMPQVPSGNIAAPTMMIGERGAAFIKEDWLQ